MGEINQQDSPLMPRVTEHLWAHRVGKGKDVCVLCKQEVTCKDEDGPAHTAPEPFGL